MSQLEFKLLHEKAKLPTRGTSRSAGWDLYALEDCVVEPTKKGPLVPVRTGVAAQYPTGFYGRVAGRSGVCYKHALLVTAGVIDQDYVDEIKVLFVNPTDVPVKFAAGERVAQLVVERYYDGESAAVTEFSSKQTEKHAGFGSTGM